MNNGTIKRMAVVLGLATATMTMCALAAEPAEPTLRVGDPAPKLQLGKWVQGEPVKEFEKGKAYIVEFWATWCGPCRVSIPHLNEIHQKYKGKGLVVIGQDCFEHDESLVAPFVKKLGDKMTYRVALDDKEGSEKGKMAETWMEAAGRRGIPSAFLVDATGVIAWIGHPMALEEKTIEAVLDGKFNVTKAAAEYKLQQKNEAQLVAVWSDLNRAMQKKDWETASAKVDEAERLLPENQRDRVGMIRFKVLIAQKNYPSAYKLAATLSDAQPDNAMLQNDLAWQIATDDSIEQRDLDLAERFATRANVAAKSSDAAVMDTLARVLFMEGKKAKAITMQEKAVKLAEGDSKKNLQTTLASYKKGELPKAE